MTFAALLTVQKHDTMLDQLRHRRASVPQRGALGEAERELASLLARQSEVEAEQLRLDGRRAVLESEVAELERRARDLDRRLRSGDVTATRELTAMVEQVEALKRRQSVLEDEELELMVALEPVDAEVAALAERRAELEGRADLLRSELAQAEAVIDGEIKVVAEVRAGVAAGIDGALLARYEQLRTRLGGVGAAPLVGASCGGCHLAFSATELDRIRHQPPDALVTCDQCGRILVR